MIFLNSSISTRTVFDSFGFENDIKNYTIHINTTAPRTFTFFAAFLPLGIESFIPLHQQVFFVAAPASYATAHRPLSSPLHDWHYQIPPWQLNSSTLTFSVRSPSDFLTYSKYAVEFQLLPTKPLAVGELRAANSSTTAHERMTQYYALDWPYARSPHRTLRVELAVQEPSDWHTRCGALPAQGLAQLRCMAVEWRRMATGRFALSAFPICLAARLAADGDIGDCDYLAREFARSAASQTQAHAVQQLVCSEAGEYGRCALSCVEGSVFAQSSSTFSPYRMFVPSEASVLQIRLAKLCSVLNATRSACFSGIGRFVASVEPLAGAWDFCEKAALSVQLNETSAYIDACRKGAVSHKLDDALYNRETPALSRRHLLKVCNEMALSNALLANLCFHEAGRAAVRWAAYNLTHANEQVCAVFRGHSEDAERLCSNGASLQVSNRAPDTALDGSVCLHADQEFRLSASVYHDDAQLIEPAEITWRSVETKLNNSHVVVRQHALLPQELLLAMATRPANADNDSALTAPSLYVELKTNGAHFDTSFRVSLTGDYVGQLRPEEFVAQEPSTVLPTASIWFVLVMSVLATIAAIAFLLKQRKKKYETA